MQAHKLGRNIAISRGWPSCHSGEMAWRDGFRWFVRLIACLRNGGCTISAWSALDRRLYLRRRRLSYDQ